MVRNTKTFQLFRPDLETPSYEDAEPAFAGLNPFGVGLLDPIHVSNAVLFLTSDEARYISGTQLSVDAGAAIK